MNSKILLACKCGQWFVRINVFSILKLLSTRRNPMRWIPLIIILQDENIRLGSDIIIWLYIVLFSIDTVV